MRIKGEIERSGIIRKRPSDKIRLPNRACWNILPRYSILFTTKGVTENLMTASNIILRTPIHLNEVLSDHDKPKIKLGLTQAREYFQILEQGEKLTSTILAFVVQALNTIFKTF